MLYRIKQFCKAVSPRIKKNEYAWAAKILNHQEYALFSKQSLVEQRHAIDVALDIYKQQNLINIIWSRPFCQSVKSRPSSRLRQIID